MQRYMFAFVVGALCTTPAFAGPLTLDPRAYARPLARVGAPAAVRMLSLMAAKEPAAPVVARAQAEPRPPMTRTAYVERSNLGGGFIQFLFGGFTGHPRGVASRAQRPIEPYLGPRHGRQPSAERRVALAPATPVRRTRDPRFEKHVVAYHGKEKPGTIIINTPERMLYLVQENGKALRYGIGVGRPGFTWSGVKKISRKSEWPDWRPPKEMLQRRPDLPRYMPGGPRNPLGARALYLGSSLYRIHGSNEPWTIGQAVSSGCIRMRNQDVIDLYDRVKLGAKVVVI